MTKVSGTKVEKVDNEIMNLTGSAYKVFSPIRLTPDLIRKMQRITNLEGVDDILILTRYAMTVIVGKCFDELTVISMVREFLDEEAELQGIKLYKRERG
jgi:hypothetical protein